MSSRVELLPQSRAATTSVTDVLNHEFGQVHLVRYEFTNGIDRPHEVVGQMRVQALHANARTTDAATGLGALRSDCCPSAPFGIRVVGRAQRIATHQVFEAVDAATSLETTHGFVDLRIDEPEERGHRRTVTQVRFVLYDDGSTVESSHDDRAAPGEWSTEIGLNDGNIVERRVAKAQRQNSRVRTTRETKAFAEE
jgi:hypothetical protein